MMVLNNNYFLAIREEWKGIGFYITDREKEARFVLYYGSELWREYAKNPILIIDGIVERIVKAMDGVDGE